MDIGRIDEYVLLTLKNNGWTENRRFPQAEEWIQQIEQGGFSCFPYARAVLHSFGGLKIWEVSPKTGQVFLEKYKGDASRVDARYLRPLNVLAQMKEPGPPEKYNGASFAFDALDAFHDREIVMDIKTAESRTGEKLFPIGTVEPDGLTCAAPDGNIYTLFNDSIYLSGGCIESYLNTLFIHAYKPIRIV